MDISVSILTFNSSDTIQACLQSVINSTKHLQAEVFLVDNASTDKTVNIAQDCFSSIQIIQNIKNTYFSAHNLAIERCAGKYIAILNPDIQLTQYAVNEIIRYMDANPDVVAVTPGHRLSDGRLESVAKRQITPSDCFWVYTIGQVLSPKRRRFRYSDILSPSCQLETTTPIAADVIQDSCVIIRGHELRAIRGYDSRYKLYYTEDDLCLRLSPFGKIVYWPAVEVSHVQSSSVKKESPFLIRKIRYLDMLTYLKIHYGRMIYIAFWPLTYSSLCIWWLVKRLGLGRSVHGIRE